MPAKTYQLTLCGGQRRHPARICLQQLSAWLKAGGVAELTNYRFAWRGGHPTLLAEICADPAGKAFEHALIAWCENALDRVLFDHPWDETPLIVEPADREGLFNVLSVRVEPHPQDDSGDALPRSFAAALSGAILAAGVQTLVDIKRVVPLLLADSLRDGADVSSLPQVPGPSFDPREAAALLQKKQHLHAAGRLQHGFASLDPALRQRFEPVLKLLRDHLSQLAPPALRKQLPCIVNRFGFSPREAEYLIFVATPQASARGAGVRAAGARKSPVAPL